jgi:hypothetical protein
LTVIRYRGVGRSVVRVNDIGGAIDDLMPAKRRPRAKGRTTEPADSTAPEPDDPEPSDPADGIGGTSAHG